MVYAQDVRKGYIMKPRSLWNRGIAALTSLLVLPPAHGMRRKGILLRALTLTAGKRNICKHLFANHTPDPASNGAPAALSKKNGADSSAPIRLCSWTKTR